jgi:A/G-specific adenine glycosylase
MPRPTEQAKNPSAAAVTTRRSRNVEHRGVGALAAPQSPGWRRTFRRRLLVWYRRHARDLPWRGTRDPYVVWVSEIMLQQTQVATVVPYFNSFLRRFPTVQALADAREDDVLRLWEGLGYYRRARQLHRAAQVVVAEHGGRFPRDVEAVRQLPGIGRYTAGAILSIACDAREPILEANTIRLLARLLAHRDDPRKAEGQRLLWQTAERLLPRRGAGRFNQALMELGSLICTPREPRCDACPVAELCPTFAAGATAVIPAPSTKPRVEAVREAAVVVRRKGRVLLVRRREEERWAGLWDFPRFAIDAAHGAALARELTLKVAAATGLAIGPGEHIATLKHGVTRFRITLECYAAEYRRVLRRGKPRCEQRWVAPAALADYPLSMTGRRLARLQQVRARPAKHSRL